MVVNQSIARHLTQPEMKRHRLGLQVVAEGVENEAQRDYLERHRCDIYQGYLFARPLAPENFAERMRATRNPVQCKT